MTLPFDESNVLLHDVWEKWARRVSYYGRRDSFALFREEAVMWKRCECAKKYAWAIPSDRALTLIAERSRGRLIEIGAGTGYWAHLLMKRGVDVVAVDNCTENLDHTPYCDIICDDGASYLKKHGGCDDRALFVCWPRNAGPWLDLYNGDTFMWVGEPGFGCTWSLDEDEYFKKWEFVERVELPTWPGINDELRVYKRRSVNV